VQKLRLFSLITMLVAVVMSCSLVGCSPLQRLISKANHAYAQGRYGDAIEEYGEVLKIDSTNSWAYAFRGFSYYYNEQYELAIVDITRAIQLYPSVDDYEYRGLSYYELGKYDLAIEDLGIAIDMAPGIPFPYDERSVVFYKTGQYDLAIADLNKAISIFPKDALFYSDRANVYIAIGQFSLAVADLNKTIELSEDPTLTECAEERLESLGQTRPGS
jgi:tetratricopeptide (TPR) repeat protein